jgi:hypothetical protein
VRLGGCIAVELAVGVGLCAAVGGGAFVGVRALGQEWEREAHATTASGEAGPHGRFATPALTWAEAPGRLAEVPGDLFVFDGVADELLLAALRGGPIARVKWNRGGTSLSLRVDLASGARAAFKPVQTNWQSMPRKEIAAYRINRLLGLSSVPPAIGRALPVADLLAALGPDSRFVAPRLRAEMIAGPDGLVAGEMSWWIPKITKATVDGFAIDSVAGVVRWKAYLTAGHAIPHREQRMVAQISDMVLFDYLINNFDRWSGGNVQSSPDGRVLYFMDNTLSFGGRDRDGHVRTQIFLRRSQKFSRSLVAALRSLDETALRAALEYDTGPFDVLLREPEIEGVMARRGYALDYIDGLCAAHGEDDVLVFP